NPAVTTIDVSARTGEGVDAWCAWLRGQLAKSLQPAASAF
ncbi:MAG: hypothetical protein QOF95_2341, partial [Pseudonocardiales bacterium]|nr:hypothetical protein [Pseudonocardiales bacterium]